MKITDRVTDIHYAIRDIVVPARKIEKQGHEVLHLNIGDPDKYDFDTPDFIKEANIKAIKDGKNYYGDSEGIPEVRDAIARREKKLKDVIISPDDILTLAGVSEGIDMTLASITGEGDEILLPGPNYPLYDTLVKFYGGKPVEYRCIEEEGWQPDVADIEEKITDKTKGIVVINPNNPTGAVYPKKTLKKITEIAVQNDLVIMADEVYDMITFDADFYPIENLNPDANIVSFGCLSKVYLSPGWRSGYMTFKGPDIHDLKEACMRQARARLCMNTPAQVALGAAMDGPTDHIKKTVDILRERRDYSAKRINEIEGLSVSKPEGALYMFPKIESDKFNDDEKFVLDLLSEKHVLCVHGSGFSKEYGKDHFRTVFLPELETLEEAFDRIEEFMNGN
ncbi:MAG: aminotransferase class I/II-fold pyridoxal phosphate-dependent enzyme [Candidatus Undinarchaeales archaeon]